MVERGAGLISPFCSSENVVEFFGRVGIKRARYSPVQVALSGCERGNIWGIPRREGRGVESLFHKKEGKDRGLKGGLKPNQPAQSEMGRQRAIK